MKMNKLTAAAVAVWAGVAVAQADTSTSFSFDVNQAVPDANPVGLALTTNLTVLGGTISSLTVNLDLSGGYNGDLYAYLVGPDTGFAVLLNRVGVGSGNSFGYGDAGMNITFDDSAANGDIHIYQTVAGYAGLLNGGTWQPDGRYIDPLSAPALFDSTVPSALLSSFDNSDPNGAWTLFLADLSGGGQTTVVSWGLNFVTIPEPSSLTLAALGLIGTLLMIRRRRASSTGF